MNLAVLRHSAAVQPNTWRQSARIASRSAVSWPSGTCVDSSLRRAWCWWRRSSRYAEAAGLLPAGVGQAAASAYRELRRHQHHARLNEETTQVPEDLLAAERDAILALWQHVFG